MSAVDQCGQVARAASATHRVILQQASDGDAPDAGGRVSSPPPKALQGLSLLGSASPVATAADGPTEGGVAGGAARRTSSSSLGASPPGEPSAAGAPGGRAPRPDILGMPAHPLALLKQLMGRIKVRLPGWAA